MVDAEGAGAAASLPFLVMPENDPPVLSCGGARLDPSRLTADGLSKAIASVEARAVGEDEEYLVPGLAVRDVDLVNDSGRPFGGGPRPGGSARGLLEVTIRATNGTVSLPKDAARAPLLVGDGTDDAVVAFRSSLGGVNGALAGLTYRARKDYFGSDELVVSVSDLGNYGRGRMCPGHGEGVSYDEGVGGIGGGGSSGDVSPCHQVTWGHCSCLISPASIGPRGSGLMVPEVGSSRCSLPRSCRDAVSRGTDGGIPASRRSRSLARAQRRGR